MENKKLTQNDNKNNEKEYFQIDSIKDYRETLENNSILFPSFVSIIAFS